MSETTPNAVRPDGVDVTVTQAGMVALDFDHPDAPPIVMSKSGAERVGSYLHTATARIGTEGDGD